MGKLSGRHLQVTLVRAVAQHQADAQPCLVTDEDLSGHYQQANRTTLYCSSRSVYLELSAEGMARAKSGQPIRVSSHCVS